jgi:hypothetical protein
MMLKSSNLANGQNRKLEGPRGYKIGAIFNIFASCSRCEKIIMKWGDRAFYAAVLYELRPTKAPLY